MTILSSLIKQLLTRLPTPLTGIVSGFNVLTIDNLSYWGDCADTTKIVEAGNDVSELTDKSPSGNDYTQLTGADKPKTNTFTQNGLNVIRYDGIAHFLEKTNYPNATSMTIYMVASIITAPEVGSSMFSMDSSDKDFQIDAKTATSFFFEFRGTNLGTSTFSDSTDHLGGGFKLFTIKLDFSANTVELFLNNTSIGSDSNYNTAIFTNLDARIATNRGAVRFVGMDLAEIIIVDDAAPADTDLDVFNYVQDKWAL